MTRRPAILLVLATLAAGSPASADEGTVPGCASGPPAAAVRSLVHPGADVVELGYVAGFRSALALEPLVYPGVRHRLIQARGYWCGAEGFNAAWRLTDRPVNSVDVASAYVRVAAAPYFDGVTVIRALEVSPGRVSLETHARTNGITATWIVTVDGQGVRDATWTSTGLGVSPFTAEWEGVSALPGLTRTYARLPGGLLRALEPVVQDPGGPELVTEGETGDGFTIRINYGSVFAHPDNPPPFTGSGVSPNIGQDTGVGPVDFIRTVRRVALENYQEFYDWGLRKGWPSDVGLIHVDSTNAAICMACVFIRDDFNIHISSAVLRYMHVLGWEYPDEEQALATVIGHEMLHNFQSVYMQDGGAELAYLEGVARFQESIHAYSGVSHQPLSFIYHTGRELPNVDLSLNSCNGWDYLEDRDASFRAGPFTNRTYDACYFWLSWYPNHGTSGIVDLFMATRDHHGLIDALQQATAGTFADDLAAFAQASITGRGYEWPSPGETEPVRDWGLYLERWSPPMMSDGQMTGFLRNGGILARELSEGGYVTWETPGIAVYAVRQKGSTVSRRLIDPTDEEEDFFVTPPAEGERVWLVAVYPSTGSRVVGVRLGGTPPPA